MRAAPGPRGHFIFGSMRQVRDDRIRFVSSLAREYGGIARFKLGPKTMYLISDSQMANHVLSTNHKNYSKGLGLTHAKALLGKGLLTSEGELWMQQRKLIQSVFHTKLIEQYSAVITDEVDQTLDKWQTQRDVIDVFDEMTQLTLKILARTLFNINIEDKTSQISRAFHVAVKEASDRMTNMLDMSSYLPSVHTFRFRNALRSLETLVYRLIEDRKTNSSSQTTDFLSLLVNAPGNLENKLIRDEVMTMLLAGHETTAVALSWTIFLLAKHPEYQCKLKSETSSESRYPQMIISEAMRLYPPVWIIPRKARMRDEIGGFDVEQGAQVLICVYNIHRNPHSWPQPELFDPERFGSHAQTHEAHQFMPFGLGPRVCIGKHFALLQGRILLTRLIERFTLRASQQNSQIDLDPLLTLRPRGKILVSATTTS